MVRLELTREESRLLHKVLHCFLTELGVEMAATGSEDFCSRLQGEEALAHKILARLNQQAAEILEEPVFGEYSD